MTHYCVITDDLAQAFASVEDEMRESDTRPKEAVPFHQQFSNIPASTSQGEGYPPGAMTHVYPTGTASAVYPLGNTAMHSSMMTGPGRDFNPARANFQVEDQGPVYSDQSMWQSGPANEPGPPGSVGLLPPSSGIASDGDIRTEFHPNLESVPLQDPHEGNQPV